MPLGLYFDDNCSDSRVVSALRRDGLEVVTSLEAGMYGAQDAQHLAFATERGLVVVTGDEGDFPRLSAELLQEGKTHSGIIVIKQSRFGPGEQARRLSRFAHARGETGIRGQVDYLSRWGLPSAP